MGRELEVVARGQGARVQRQGTESGGRGCWGKAGALIRLPCIIIIIV